MSVSFDILMEIMFQFLIGRLQTNKAGTSEEFTCVVSIPHR